jgi:hypothetical protein
MALPRRRTWLESALHGRRRLRVSFVRTEYCWLAQRPGIAREQRSVRSGVQRGHGLDHCVPVQLSAARQFG